MTPAGYLLKRVVPAPAWLAARAPQIRRVCSVSGCVNDDVVDMRETWQHNSFGLANSPQQICSLAGERGVDSSDATLFFYTAFGSELESDGWNFDPSEWRPRTPDDSAGVPDEAAAPGEPRSARLLGYYVVVVDYGSFHSPLSCNAMASEIPVNEDCLFDSFAEAMGAINAGKFGGGCEEGNYTIFGVYEVSG